MKTITLSFLFVLLSLFIMAQNINIQVWNISQKQTFEHETIIKNTLTKSLDLSKTSSSYHRVSVKPLLDDETLVSYVAYLLHKDNYSVEIIKVDLKNGYEVDKIHRNYIEKRTDFPQTDNKGTCPDETVQMVFSTCETSIPTAVAAVDYAGQVAQNNGFKYKILKGSQENIQAIQNWLSCNNLILFGRVGHGYTSGIVLYDGELTYNYFQNLSSNALNGKDLYFNSCEVHNAPLEPAIVGAGVEKFIGGNVNLAIGSSEEVFKCWLDEVISHNASITQSVSSCEQENYPYPGSHGVSGNGSDYLPNNTSNTLPTPISPANGSTVQSAVNFQWSSPIPAQAYRLQVSKTMSGWTAQNGFTTSSAPTSNVPVNVSQGETTYNWSGAQTGETYYWTLRSWHPNTGPSQYSQPVSFIYEETASSYCTSKGTSVIGEWIAQTKIGATSKSSGANNGYADFTSTVFYVSKGNSYDIVLTPGFASQAYNESWKVWVDFNHDKDFEDNGELIFSPELSSSVVSGNIIIPGTAHTGNTRMRISMKGDGAQTPCETFTYGEVEDYTIHIADGNTEPTVTISHPATANIGESIQFSGTASNDIEYVKVKVGIWEIATANVSNGTYSFNYTFNSAGANRQITATGYDASNNELATANSEITVTENANYSVTLNHNSTGTVGEPVSFSGNTTGSIQNVVVSVDGYQIANISVTNGQYNFNYTFNSPGHNRNVLVKAFDNGLDVAQATSTITINSNGGITENGLGIWLWYLDVTSFSSHAQLANELSSMGVKKIYIKVADGAYDPQTWPEINDVNLVNTYKNAGLDVIAWSYNRPGSERAQADALYYAAKTGYESFILDVEMEYNGKTTELHTLFQEFEQARQDAINAGYADSNFKIGCTTWGNPEDQGMHVEIIDQYVDYHMPQTYTEIWDVLNYQEYYINKATQEYRDMGCNKPIYHICAAEIGKITSAQINEYISIAGPNTSIWSVPKANMHSAIWPVIKNVNWNSYYNEEFYSSNNDTDMHLGKIYPNPAKNTIFINTEANKGVSFIRITSMSGQILFETDKMTESFINISNYKPGLYIVELTVDQSIEREKIVIK
jgi:hypothetical protein